MKQFTDVRHALRSWMTQYGWVSKLLPFHLYLLFGGIAVILTDEIIWQLFGGSFFVLELVRAFAYWAFILGIFLTLISSSIKYLPYGLWLYSIQMLFPFPFSFFSLPVLVSALVYGYLGLLAFRYSAIEIEQFDQQKQIN
ncbi:hypothetical protein [Desertibacillus haloalkaliphilus]|uniref:hypothetical protein n=1 Tax=Desertibacillus haloalkaliphilus TaxID=1328930 RepID=UPI001C275A21|nr:hypothetical protein [Desertibacillus haloalkaliphilus]MBU8908104.1 hypothetical protein [Desertibacillus haloalkaliphilus]